jgi:hypothetical protein
VQFVEERCGEVLSRVVRNAKLECLRALRLSPLLFAIPDRRHAQHFLAKVLRLSLLALPPGLMRDGLKQMLTSI